MIRRSLFALGLFAACSSGGGSGATGGAGGGATPTGGSGGGGMAAAPLAYKPCDQAMRVGGFVVRLDSNPESTPFTAVGGGVKNAVDPTNLWQETAREGDCRLDVGPMLVCNPPCAFGKTCSAAKMCIDEPTSQDLGTVTITGLGAPLVVQAAAPGMYSGSLTAPYPPFAPESEIIVKTSGGKYPAFMLAGRGIEPLQFEGKGIKVARNQPLPFTWTASAKNKSARIHVKLDIAHHGGIAARINCDLADTGSYTIPATLINKLMDRGLAGFPTLTLTRRTLDSTTIAPGCVEFAVASEEARDIDVEGVVSCTQAEPCMGEMGCKSCPAGMKCEGFRCL